MALRTIGGSQESPGASPDRVVLYDANNNPILSTNEGGGFSIDVHATNPSIEQITGAAHNTKNIAMAGMDGSGAIQPPLIDATSRRAQVDVTKPLAASSPTFTSVGATSTQVLASNANRKGAAFINTSTATISFGIGVAAVLNSGITLGPMGVWVMDTLLFSTGIINAIASVAASNLAVQEMA